MMFNKIPLFFVFLVFFCISSHHRVNGFTTQTLSSSAKAMGTKELSSLTTVLEKNLSPKRSNTILSAKKDKGESGLPEDPLAFFGPLRFIVPALFIGQIVFLATAQQVSGGDNLKLYGRLGNEYIRKSGGYDQSKGIFERQSITSAGQKIWFDNVLRDLENGGPVKPPIKKP
eukprot:CAMPEP_0194133774 /NCGR_PEP_ID=MMETSP0152-20130528/3802_1 /TAXON_ID=1049557 /ORGANISM="Thalassiothrix antarctica, Strain L6-D1" /LENGTH=171 /DNA_ID=CAMNT_0038829131 /DNA_START=99 /DNA_END=614 /DNA_ORIENTATION=-